MFGVSEHSIQTVKFTVVDLPEIDKIFLLLVIFFYSILVLLI